MKKIKINIPEGTEYLSYIWDELKKQLPSGHYILNKNLCNCGATEAFLRDSKTKTILASPRKQLLYNKHNQHLDDTTFTDSKTRISILAIIRTVPMLSSIIMTV